MARTYATPALTQESLGRLLGVSRPTIASWETGRIAPRPGQLSPLAKAVGVDVQWFFDGDPMPPAAKHAPAPEPVRMLTPDEMSRAESLIVRHRDVAIPLWRAGFCSDKDEVYFEEENGDEFIEVAGFYTNGEIDGYAMCIAKGFSMEPRIEYGSKVLIKRDPNVPLGRIVAAQRPDGAIFIKILQRTPTGVVLRSFNDKYPDMDLTDWLIRGGVVMIQHPYDGRPNLEWDEGRYLRG
jgi:SOS-response transcriptional repressor LexA